MLAANHKAAVGSGYRPSTTVSQMMMPLFYMLRCGGDDISPYYVYRVVWGSRGSCCTPYTPLGLLSEFHGEIQQESGASE